jgi:hypothetical protein
MMSAPSRKRRRRDRLSRLRTKPCAASGAASVAAVVAGTLLLATPAHALSKHTFSTSFGTATSTPPDPVPLTNPTGVAVDQSDGDVYVANPAPNEADVEKFTPSGEFLLILGKEVNKTAVEDHGTEAEQNVCTAASHDECQPGAAGSSPGAFVEPTYLVVDNSPGGEGDLYVGDPGDELVSKFYSSGDLVQTWGENGPHGQPNGQIGRAHV